MPEEYKQFIQKHLIENKKQPFWTFSGLIIMGLSILLLSGLALNKNHKDNGYFYDNAKTRAQWVDKAIVGDYYNFWIKPKDENKPSKKLYFVVKKIKKDSIYFVPMLGNNSVDSIQEMKWLKREIQDSLAKIAITQNYKAISFSKKDIKNTIPTEKKTKFTHSYPIQGLGNLAMYTFSSYYRLNEEQKKKNQTHIDNQRKIIPR